LVDGEVAGKIYSQRPVSHFRVFQRKKLVLQLLLLLLLPVPEALVGLYIVGQKNSCADIYIFRSEK
jgi:ABC-type maltose transport system permease subunit